MSPPPEEPVITTESTGILEGLNGQKCVVLVQNYVGPPPPPMPTQDDFEGASGLTRKASMAVKRASQAGATSLSSVFTLCNSAIGAGVLSLPFAISEAGVIGGLIFCIVIGSCEAFTLYVLSKFSERYNACSYGQLIRKALGRKLAATLSIVLLLYLMGSCIAYQIIIGDTFSALAVKFLGHDNFFSDRKAVIITISVVVIFPLCLPRRLGALAAVSAAAVFGFIYTALVVCIRSYQIVSAREPRFKDVELFVWDIRALYAIPIIVFGYNCHANVVSVFSELDDEPGQLIKALPSNPSHYMALGILAPKPGTVKMVGMLGVILSAVTLIMVGYVSVGIAGYMAYPNSVQGNVLNAFSNDDILIQIARFVIGCVIIGHFPLNHFPARRSLEEVVIQGLGWNKLPRVLSVVFTAVFVGGSMGVALVVSDLGVVLHLIGGSAASFTIFFLPGLLLINAAVVKHSKGQLAEMESTGSGSATNLADPLLQGSLHGIKKTGLIYSPRKSWWAGMALVALSISILVITLYTAFVN